MIMDRCIMQWIYVLLTLWFPPVLFLPFILLKLTYYILFIYINKINKFVCTLLRIVTFLVILTPYASTMPKITLEKFLSVCLYVCMSVTLNRPLVVLFSRS
jgi:hypothetical protein